ncbi:cation diffusion facilitator family transporter [Paenibacillus rigui]|uniref:Cation-efflux pump n=1 Tax=Paenibacillus rigui TaxID=554312 RepID=A0A229UV86_9BACL|nr:cation diffusion facilitator family transporter [Paenibacillus rigui]OXM86819.1 cation-efflux pump [Paenibacillus rigui]
MTEERVQKAETGAWIGIIGNLGLAVLKGGVGYFSGSKALIADALHSASDAAGSFAVLARLRNARLSSDEDRAHGQTKSETLTTIFLSVLLLAIGCEIAIHSAKAIYHGVDAAPKATALLAIAISIVIKEVIFQYKYRLRKQLSSQQVLAYAWERRSDMYASIAAFFGVLGAILGNYSGYTYLYYLDPLAGVFIAVLVLRMGYRLVTQSIHNHMEHLLQEEDARALIQTVQTIKGVIAVDELRAREHGHYVLVDVKISVNPRISIQEGHEIARLAKQALMKRFHHVSDVHIHVNPYDPGYPYKNNVDSDTDHYPTLLH